MDEVKLKKNNEMSERTFFDKIIYLCRWNVFHGKMNLYDHFSFDAPNYSKIGTTFLFDVNRDSSVTSKLVVWGHFDYDVLAHTTTSPHCNFEFARNN